MQKRNPVNKKLAEEGYLGLVPPTTNERGELQLSGNGKIEDWLVKMRRVPEETMLNYAISHRYTNEERLKQAALLLTEVYKEEHAVPISGAQYTKKLQKEIIECYKALIHPEYKLPEQIIEELTNKQLNFLDKHISGAFQIFAKAIV